MGSSCKKKLAKRQLAVGKKKLAKRQLAVGKKVVSIE